METTERAKAPQPKPDWITARQTAWTRWRKNTNEKMKSRRAGSVPLDCGHEILTRDLNPVDWSRTGAWTFAGLERACDRQVKVSIEAVGSADRNVT